VSTVWTCPLCTHPAAQAADATYEYCADCQGYTAATPPPGHGWVEFTGGGDTDGCFRLVELRLLYVGEEWSPLGTSVYAWDGSTYVYERG